MARIFKPTITRYVDPATCKRCASTDPGRQKTSSQSKTWRGEFRDSDGILRSVTLCANKQAAQTMLNERIQESNSGDPFEKHRRRPLTEHVADFERHIEAKARTAQHVRQTIRRIDSGNGRNRRKKLTDLDPDCFSRWRADQRDTNNFGVTTSNGYVTALKMFGRWLMTSRRTRMNPFISLSGLNARADRRHERRTLSPEDFSKLLTTTRSSKQSFRRLGGESRFLLYLLAGRSGLRCQELASLTARSFDFDADSPTVTIQAGDAKNGRSETLPLPRDVAQLLHQWIVARQGESDVILRIGERTEAPLWPGSWINQAAKMMRGDLAGAGIPFEDEEGRKFDFHALRSQYITDLARSGVPLATTQKLARHSDPRLTARSYTRLSLTDLDAAVQQLPEAFTVSMAKSGTDDAETGGKMVAGLVAGPGAKTCLGLTTVDATPPPQASPPDITFTPQLQGFESDCDPLEKAPRGVQHSHQGLTEQGAYATNKLRQCRSYVLYPWNPVVAKAPASATLSIPVRDALRLARYYQSLLDSGQFKSRAALARHLGVSRARVTQVLRRLITAKVSMTDIEKLAASCEATAG